ncbi:MAG: ATP-grasp domain-containing protein [Oscillospiraceae bacterium]|nr:ATP-grasp domain-containing protein [Oscillospiraceae bacterium]
MQVIVTDTHTRMSLAVLRELGQAGFEITAVVREDKPKLGHACRYVKQRVTLPVSGYTNALLQLPQGSVFLPTTMETLTIAAHNHTAFSSRFHTLLSNAQDLTQAADKPAVAAIARTLGLLVPQDYPLDAPQFPCVLKYRNGEVLGLPADQRYAIAHTSAEFEEKYQAMTQRATIAHHSPLTIHPHNLFASQYIPGNAYGVSAVLDNNSNPVAIFCHERIREYPITGGPACCAQAVWHPRMIDGATKLLKSLQLKGFAMVEFKGTPNEPYLLEVNPRIWGTYPLTYICNAQMATAYVQSAQKQCRTPNTKYQTSPPWLGQKMQYLPNDLCNLATALRTRTKQRGNAIADLFSPKCRGGVFAWRDLRSSLTYAIGLLKTGGRA